MEAVEEIMRLYRSLPRRPSVDEVEAAMSVIKTAEIEKEMKVEEISRLQNPPDIPQELFFVLQEARKNMVLLQCLEQKKEAINVVELDKRLQVFDELVQKASEVVKIEDGGVASRKAEKGETKVSAIVPRIEKTNLNLVNKEKDEKNKGAFDIDKRLTRVSSLNSEVLSGGGESGKLSLIQVASLIETSSRNATRILDLQGKLMDQVEWLPTSLVKLQDITELNLSENRVMALPAFIGSLRLVKKLDIHSNQLINLPDSFGELSNLTHLDLHANRMKSLPSSFANLTGLVDLDLSSNQFSTLPVAIGNLANLKKLNVETNELEELPYTIGSCTSLIELRLDFNQLKALPEAIGKLENLEILTLHYNRIKGLPTTMASLLMLKVLDVSFNELESIPESLCFATNLVKLDVGRNFADLTRLPRSIGNLEKLEELDISSNQIRILPDSFRMLSNLRVFKADETPLDEPPKDVVKLGAQAVVQYMVNLVASRNTISQHHQHEKGFWSGVSSLMRSRS